MGGIAKGVPRICHVVVSPASLGYPLSVFNKQLDCEKCSDATAITLSDKQVAGSSHIFGPLQHTATQCNTMQHNATHCNTLQHTATHCNTLQHTTRRSSTLFLTRSAHCTHAHRGGRVPVHPPTTFLQDTHTYSNTNTKHTDVTGYKSQARFHSL